MQISGNIALMPPILDLLDVSLWDSFKESEENAFKGRSLMSYFTELDWGKVRLVVAGKLQTGQDI